MKIAAYVLNKQAKQTYAHESFNVRAWPGLSVVIDVATRGGYEIEWASKSNVHNYDVILVSITSDCDWWPFVAERVRWQKNPKQTVIIGGPGVLNIAPFIGYGQCFVLGRGEDLISPILEELVKGNHYQNESVIWSDNFNPLGQYKIMQAKQLYPHTVTLTNGKPYTESSIGCPNKCYFCAYTWHRKYIGNGKYTAGKDSMSANNREYTILDLLRIPTEEWGNDGPVRIVGLDGMSERLRMKANKKITREMWREFLLRLSTINPPHQVKVYNIVGFPAETESDWDEFIEDIDLVDNTLLQGKQWSLLCHFTPFRPMPTTPSATWPVAYKDYRGKIAKYFKKRNMPGNVFFQGNRFWCVEGMGTDGLATVVLSMIVLRGIERDKENIERVALSSQFWAASATRRLATLEANFNVKDLFREYKWEELPTRYLRSYSAQESVKRLS